jgi:hypothetical protein
VIGGGPGLLHIYDADDLLIDVTASVRNFGIPGLSVKRIHQVPVHGGKVGLLTELDNLVKTGRSFRRALFETHGSTGAISFGGEKVTGDTFRTLYNNRGYERIFNYMWARIYFNGCNVADDPKGWDFLDAAGKVFLRLGGGTTFASTGVGRPIIFTGHVHHFGSDTYYSLWAPGGHFVGHSKD